MSGFKLSIRLFIRGFDNSHLLCVMADQSKLASDKVSQVKTYVRAVTYPGDLGSQVSQHINIFVKRHSIGHRKFLTIIIVSYSSILINYKFFMNTHTLTLSKLCTVSRTIALNLLSQSTEFILCISYKFTTSHGNNVNDDAGDATYPTCLWSIPKVHLVVAPKDINRPPYGLLISLVAPQTRYTLY